MSSGPRGRRTSFAWLSHLVAAGRPRAAAASSMRMLPLLATAGAAVLAACAAPVPAGSRDGLHGRSPSTGDVGADAHRPGDVAAAVAAADGMRASPSPGASRWADGRVMAQGFLGATIFDRIERTGGNTLRVDGSGEELSQLPSIGGGMQWKLGGERVDFGFEGNLAFNWRSNARAFASGSGGAVVAADIDLLLVELYGGPFANLFLGDSARVYVSAGPVMDWARYDQSGASLDGTGNGFGLGVYARTGLEFDIGSGNLLGFGVRWTRVDIDLDGGLGRLEVDGLTLAVTLSRWF